MGREDEVGRVDEGKGRLVLDMALLSMKMSLASDCTRALFADPLGIDLVWLRCVYIMDPSDCNNNDDASNVMQHVLCVHQCVQIHANVYTTRNRERERESHYDHHLLYVNRKPSVMHGCGLRGVFLIRMDFPTWCSRGRRTLIAGCSSLQRHVMFFHVGDELC